MSIQQHHIQGTGNTIEHSSVVESELFRNILSSMNTGIGLVDKEFTLLYCNSAFSTLLQNGHPVPLGKKVYLNQGLKLRRLLKIRKQLGKVDSWEEIFPELGKGLKIVITRINFPLPTSASPLSNAHYMLTASDHSNIISQQIKLAEANALAEKAEETKTEFLSHISHELRTPLSAVIGFAQLLQIEPNLSEQQEGHLNEIMSAGDYLLKLINEILNLSKVDHDHGNIKLLSEGISTEKLIGECVSMIKPLAQKANIQVLQRESNTYLLKDRVRLKQILINLLSNAIKYNHHGGQVVVKSFCVEGNSIRIEVQDSGTGIPPQLLNTIFNPFERLGIKDKQIQGTGIGLMITRRLVNLMDGSISVVSEPGKGSIFSVDFSVEAAVLNKNHTRLPEEPRNIIWIGKDFNHQQFAESLTDLRPALRFYPANNISSAIRLSALFVTDLIFITVQDSLDQLEKPTSEAIALFKGTPTIAVGSMEYSTETPFDLESTEYLSAPLNTVSFMEIIDRQLSFPNNRD